MTKHKTITTMLSVMMTTSLFLSANAPGSIAHAKVGPISYNIPDAHYEDFSYFSEKYNHENDLSDKTVLLTTNDVHGAIEGYPYIASLKNHLKNNLHANVLLIDMGDFSQDKEDPVYVTPKDGNGVACMNAAGYDIATLGNHELNDISALKKNLKAANFDIVNSNIIDDKLSKYLKPNCKRTFGSGDSEITIGFFGIDTRDAQKVNKVKMRLGKDMHKCAQEQVDALRNEDKKADLVICLSHLGLEDSFEKDGERSVDLYNNVEGIDLVLDGHSHSVITPPKKDDSDYGKREPILSTGEYLNNVGVVVIDNNTKSIDDTFLISKEHFPNFGVEGNTQVIVDKIISDYNKKNGISDNSSYKDKEKDNDKNKDKYKYNYKDKDDDDDKEDDDDKDKDSNKYSKNYGGWYGNWNWYNSGYGFSK